MDRLSIHGTTSKASSIYSVGAFFVKVIPFNVFIVRFCYHKSMLKFLYRVGGSISVGLATAGIFLPVLPTTPFILLAIFLFGKSQPEKMDEIMQHPKLGSFVKNYLDPQGIPIKSKVKALIVLWRSILVSVIFFIPIMAIKVLVLGIALLVSISILIRSTKV